MTIVEQIVARKIAAVIVYESDNVIAFADHDPINYDHLLICPKAHYRTLIDLPDSILLEINQVAKSLYNRLAAKFNPDGISFIQNNGAYPDVNALDHYHLHIFPRFKDDKFGWTSSELGLQTLHTLNKSLLDL